jgi:hypothetical protein
MEAQRSAIAVHEIAPSSPPFVIINENNYLRIGVFKDPEPSDPSDAVCRIVPTGGSVHGLYGYLKLNNSLELRLCYMGRWNDSYFHAIFTNCDDLSSMQNVPNLQTSTGGTVSWFGLTVTEFASGGVCSFHRATRQRRNSTTALPTTTIASNYSFTPSLLT